MWNLKKNDTNEYIYKIDILIENKVMVTKGKGEVGYIRSLELAYFNLC